MTRRILLVSLTSLLGIVSVPSQADANGAPGTDDGWVRKRFREVDTLFANPSQAVLRFSLVDTEGRVCFTADSKADTRQWLSGELSVNESLELPATLRAGEYNLAVALADPAHASRCFRLAIEVPEREGRYRVSRLWID